MIQGMLIDRKTDVPAIGGGKVSMNFEIKLKFSYDRKKDILKVILWN